jgi:hypothetical protein
VAPVAQQSKVPLLRQRIQLHQLPLHNQPYLPKGLLGQRVLVLKQPAHLQVAVSFDYVLWQVVRAQQHDVAWADHVTSDVREQANLEVHALGFGEVAELVCVGAMGVSLMTMW